MTFGGWSRATRHPLVHHLSLLPADLWLECEKGAWARSWKGLLFPGSPLLLFILRDENEDGKINMPINHVT